MEKSRHQGVDTSSWQTGGSKVLKKLDTFLIGGMAAENKGFNKSPPIKKSVPAPPEKSEGIYKNGVLKAT